jgi:hypothetical protein
VKLKYLDNFFLIFLTLLIEPLEEMLGVVQQSGLYITSGLAGQYVKVEMLNVYIAPFMLLILYNVGVT